jgi:hypothetical protein
MKRFLCWIGWHRYGLYSSELWNTDIFARGPNNAIKKTWRCADCGKYEVEYLQ